MVGKQHRRGAGAIDLDRAAQQRRRQHGHRQRHQRRPLKHHPHAIKGRGDVKSLFEQGGLRLGREEFCLRPHHDADRAGVTGGSGNGLASPGGPRLDHQPVARRQPATAQPGERQRRGAAQPARAIDFTGKGQHRPIASGAVAHLQALARDAARRSSSRQAPHHRAAPRNPRRRAQSRPRPPTQRSVMPPCDSSTAGVPAALPSARCAAAKAARSIGPDQVTPRRRCPRRPASCTVVSGPACSTTRTQRAISRRRIRRGKRCESAPGRRAGTGTARRRPAAIPACWSGRSPTSRSASAAW